MIKIIGLMVAIYAMARMAQIPIEMSGSKDVWLSLPHPGQTKDNVRTSIGVLFR